MAAAGLSLCCRLYPRAAASIVAPMPVSSRLPHASGWLLHRRLSCHAGASPATPAPLSLRRHLSHCAAASLFAPRSRPLVVALQPILTCRRLSCHAVWLLLCHLSLRAAVSIFAPSLIALDPLNPNNKRIGLLGGPSSINPMRWRRTKGLMKLVSILCDTVFYCTVRKTILGSVLPLLLRHLLCMRKRH